MPTRGATIAIDPSVKEIDVSSCVPLVKFTGNNGGGDVYLKATDSVEIQGNGATIRGHSAWINNYGVQDLNSCPQLRPGVTSVNIQTSDSTGFIQVGEVGGNSAGVDVTIRDVTLIEFDGVAEIHGGASLTFEDSNFQRIFSEYCGREIIYAVDESNFTARRTRWFQIYNFGDVFGLGRARVPNPVIQGYPGGVLTLEESEFRAMGNSGGAISWQGPVGSLVNIVSSHFAENPGGLWTDGDVTVNIVNTVWDHGSTGTMTSKDLFWHRSRGALNFEASTVVIPSAFACDADCEDFDAGWIARDPSVNAGPINFKSTVVYDPFPDATPGVTVGQNGRLLWGGSDNAQAGFTADEYSYITPNTNQPIDVIKQITQQPALVMGAPVFNFDPLGPLEKQVIPAFPGVLIDVVGDADCSGANQLLNPSDASCVTSDVFGSPRIDGNNRRNIGAVQLNVAPHIDVVGTAPGEVDVKWSKPVDPSAGTLTGYKIEWREQGGGSWQSQTIGDPDTLIQQITGLTNGTPYEFQVKGVYSATEGPASNVEVATPFGSIGTPIVTAQGNDGQVDLSWTKPASGGYTINHYTVTWQEVGSTTLTGATIVFGENSLTTIIPGLVNGTVYEFKVSAQTTTGLVSNQGVTTATPVAPLALTYPPQVTLAEGESLMLSPFPQNLLGTPSYTLISPPSWATIDVSTGVVTVGPTTATAATLTIQLTDGAVAGRTVTTAVDVNVLSSQVSPYIAYGGYNFVAGVPITPIYPVVVGFSNPVFSLPAGEALPPGLSLDASSGAITGTPSTATGTTKAPTIRADEGAMVNQTVVQIQVTPTLSYSSVNAVVGEAYSLAPVVSPTQGSPSSFAISGGTLPAGLVLNASSGVISGTPTVAQPVAKNVQITYTTGAQSVSYSVSVAVASTPPTQAVITGGPNGLQATLDVLYGCNNVVSASFVGAPDSSSKPLGYDFPFGLLDFELDQCSPGINGVGVQVRYSSAIPSGAVFYKEEAGQYSAYPATIAGDTTVFYLTDDGAGDDDPTAGVIHDPSGIAVPVVSTVAVPVNALPLWMLGLLASFAAALGASRSRAKSSAN